MREGLSASCSNSTSFAPQVNLAQVMSVQLNYWHARPFPHLEGFLIQGAGLVSEDGTQVS